jgi:hypothetical protein
VYPDTNAHGGGERPQPLYSVRFSARELWGSAATGRDRLYIDLWEDYLQLAPSDKGRKNPTRVAGKPGKKLSAKSKTTMAKRAAKKSNAKAARRRAARS